jgi:two-component system chemotaxis response regulator CheY
MTKRIITVEDSTSLREMISFTLSEAGYEVSQAEDGRDALDKLTGFKADLVITDLNMPKMNGIELTSALRGNPVYRFVPIIFLTTESQLQKKQAAKEAGATGWIVKPFKPDQLLQVVRKVLGCWGLEPGG